MTLPNWARAHASVPPGGSGPLLVAAIRERPEDFRVTERLGWDLSGDGEHDYLWIEKTGTNTEWLARQLARFADVPARDVGYAGLKDRHAVTKQWFSVPRWHAPDWGALEIDGVRVIDVQRHLRKLRKGAHRANEFLIRLRTQDMHSHVEALQSRIERLQQQGVPNYFGEQRFGRDAGNLELADAWATGARLRRHKRGIAISTMRSFAFNESLHERVIDGTWNRLVPGDKANLAGSGSVFDVDVVDDELENRCAAMDIHPAGLLIGDGSAYGNAPWQKALDGARVEPGSRSYRLPVAALDMVVVDGGIDLSFSLGRGAFATAVLREIADVRDASSD